MTTDYVFWFTSHPETTAFLVTTEDYDEAVDRLVEHCGGTMPETFSTEREDYERDIEEGNIFVLTPTNITDEG